jgi:hypothetical protein
MATAWYADPGWWAAIGTYALVLVTFALVGVTFTLVVITGAAVFFGKRAADAAVTALRLESEPLLVVTDPRVSPHRRVESLLTGVLVTDPTHWYIVDEDVYHQVWLRRNLNELPTTKLKPPGGYLEIKNVGRSPAVGITLHLFVYTGEKRTNEQLQEAGPNDFITIDGIGPQSSYFIGISNQLSEAVLKLPGFRG